MAVARSPDFTYIAALSRKGYRVNQPTNIKADIIAYTREYGEVVRSWIDSEETYRMVCQGKDFPPPEDVVESWQREGVLSFLLLADRKPVAYAEFWRRPQELALQVAHLIVDPYKRSEGYGTKMLQLLYERAAARSDVAKVVMNIYNDNPIAVGCFLKAGFELAGTTNYTEGLRMVRYIK